MTDWTAGLIETPAGDLYDPETGEEFTLIPATWGEAWLAGLVEDTEVEEEN